jgi:hypothetical protein
MEGEFSSCITKELFLLWNGLRMAHEEPGRSESLAKSGCAKYARGGCILRTTSGQRELDCADDEQGLL